MSLLLNMLSRLFTTFLPRSKRLLISLLRSPSAVILEPRKIKSATVCTVSSICHEVMELDAMILVFWTLSFKPIFSLCLFNLYADYTMWHAGLDEAQAGIKIARRHDEEVKSLSRAWLFATQWTVACTKLPCPWDFLGKSTGVGCHFLLQGIFPTQGSNPDLPHCRQTLYHLSHQGSLGGMMALSNYQQFLILLFAH